METPTNPHPPTEHASLDPTAVQAVQAMREALLRQTIQYLNDVYRLDPGAVHALLSLRTPCNPALAKHPSIMVGVAPVLSDADVHIVGVLGLLNGLCEQLFGGSVAMLWSSENGSGRPPQLMGFAPFIPLFGGLLNRITRAVYEKYPPPLYQVRTWAVDNGLAYSIMVRDARKDMVSSITVGTEALQRVADASAKKLSDPSMERSMIEKIVAALAEFKTMEAAPV